MDTLLTPDSPCSATVTPDDKGGMTVTLFVPTYEGGANLTISAERSNDGDWVVSIPWPDDPATADKGLLLSGPPDEQYEVVNGLLYLGAPDVPVARVR